MHIKVNGKNVRVPEKQIESMMKALELTKEEAIQVWLEDEGYEENAEQAALDEYAKGVKIPVGARSEKSSSKKGAKKGPREDKEKQEIIANLAEYLADAYEDVTVVNIGKIITFKIGDNEYKLDLVKKRKAK